MSYSFSVKAKTKKQAAIMVGDKLAEVVVAQPAHEADAKGAFEAATAFIDVLIDPKENESILVSVNGSLSWNEAGQYTAANVTVSARVVED